jgi:hypothetical protein
MDENAFALSLQRAAALALAGYGDTTYPDACFIIEQGAEKDENGKVLQKFKHLPHHSKAATDPNSNSTVDLPHLRNAMARAGQVKCVKEDTAAFIKRARAHLIRHAKALLKSYQDAADDLAAICKDHDEKDGK